jgi:hypothetical protein
LCDCLRSVPPRETREGWLLLTVETEANGDSTCANERVLLGWFVGRDQRIHISQRRQYKFLKIYLFHCLRSVPPRETREGWLLLTCETEICGDSKSTNERVPSLVGPLSCSRAGTGEFFPALAAL